MTNQNFSIAPPNYFRTHHNRHYGKRRAVVANVDDPKQLGRVRVWCQSIYGDDQSPWALPCFQGGGATDSGTFDVPPVGAYVFVEFEEGLPEHPIYSGGFYFPLAGDRPSDGSPVEESEGYQVDNNPVPKHARGEMDGTDMDGSPRGGDAPRSNFAGEYPNVRSWSTPAGHAIELDDTPNEERVMISHSSGSIIEMLSDGSIHILSDGQKLEVVKSKSETVDGNSRTQVKGSCSYDVAGDFTLNIGGSYRINHSGPADISRPGGTEVVEGSREVVVEGYDKLRVNNHKSLITGSDYSVAVGGNHTKTVSGTSQRVISNVQNVSDPSQYTDDNIAQNGRIRLASSDPTGKTSMFGLEAQSLASPSQSPAPAAGQLGPFVRLGNILQPMTAAKQPLTNEPLVMGEQLVLYLTQLHSLLNLWLTDYLSHSHPWFSPAYTSSAMANILPAQLQALQTTFLNPTGAKGHAMLQSDIAFLTKV